MSDDKDNNNNILSLASSKLDKDDGIDYKLTVIYKQNGPADEVYECNFFGVSIDAPNFLLIGKDTEKEFTPMALINNDSILRIDIKVI